MTGQNGQFSLLDAIAVVSFLIGLANYSENVDQSQVQDTVNSAVLDIHIHLKEQDDKLTKIIELLGKGESN